jgi:purine-binding chemotaxis protein CheW
MEGTQTRHVVFRLGAETFAAPVEAIEEIMPLPGLTRVPRAPGWLLGLTNRRGDIIPVVDVRHWLACAPAPRTATTRLLVVSAEAARVATLVDATLEIRPIPPEEILPPESSRRTNPHVKGVHFWAGRLVSIIDIRSVLASDSAQAFR